MMLIKKFKIAFIPVFMGVLLLEVSPEAQGRIDPLRIMTLQAPEQPAIYIILDTSGSMRWLPNVNDADMTVRPSGAPGSTTLSVGGDWTDTDSPWCSGVACNSGGGNGYWARITWSTQNQYSYWYFVPSSRIAFVKNFFGNCVPIYLPREDALNFPTCSGATVPCKGTDGNFTYYRFSRNGGPTNGAYVNAVWTYNQSIRRWQFTWNWVNYTLNRTAPPAGDPAYTIERQPLDFVATNGNVALWGMGRYSGQQTTRVTPGLPTDKNENQNSINAVRNAMTPIRGIGACAGPSIVPSGSTPTTRGLNFVKSEIDQWYRVMGNRGALACGRRFFTILITDGQSNTCNPEGGSWSNCPNNWDDYPAGRTDEMFLMQAASYTTCSYGKTTPTPVQTFAIGISPDVSRCEMNMNAYMGRTDAFSDDAGVNWQGNPRLPQNISGTTPMTNFNPAQGDYAFFANNPDEFNKAMETILSAILAGDYNTGSPTGSISAGAGASFQEFLVIPSTKMPGWKGTYRAYQVAKCNDSSSHDYDLSTLTFEELCNRLAEPGKTIYVGAYSQPGCNPPNPGDPLLPHFHIMWDSACSLLAQANPTAVDYSRTVYTVDPGCKVGTSTGGPDPACKILVKLQKDSSTAQWLRSNITNIVWDLYDFDGDGITANVDNDDIIMFIDFILGGDGNGVKRAWLEPDIIGNGAEIVATPVAYTLSNVPPKTTFDKKWRRRQPIVYGVDNGGMLHAFWLKHRLNDPTTEPIEKFAFIPPQVFDQLLQMFLNYRSDPDVPTGQNKQPNFDSHIWTMAAPLNQADVWMRWKSGGDWATILLLPLGPNDPGLYAIDVTDPSKPPEVLWYWQSSNNSLAKAVWNAAALGPSPAGGKTSDGGKYYEQWMVAVNTTGPQEDDEGSLIALLNADTGKELRTFPQDVELPTSGVAKFHVYSHPAMIDTDVNVSKPDMLNTHSFYADTKGHVHVVKTLKEDSNLWTFNTNNPLIDKTADRPLYYVPSLAHALGKSGLVLGYASGSIFEDDPDVNEKFQTFCQGARPFCTELYVDVANIDQKDKPNRDFWNLEVPNDTNHRFKVGPINDSFTLQAKVDTDGDGNPDTVQTVSPTSQARITGRPLVVMEPFSQSQGSKGTAYFLLFNPQVFNPDANACTGKTYLIPVSFTLSGGGTPQFASAPSLGTAIEIGYGVATNVVSVGGYLVVMKTGYGGSISVPMITSEKGHPPLSPIPLFGGFKRIE